MRRRARGLLVGAVGLASLASAALGDEVRDARGYRVIDAQLIGRNRALGGDIYWVDRERVLLIGATPDDYAAAAPGVRERRFRLLLWTARNQTVLEQHPADIANGSLCFFGGYVRLEFTSDYRGRPAEQRWQVLEGPLGEERLRPLDGSEIAERRSREKRINPYTCREYEPGKLPSLGARVEPLLEGEFVSQARRAGAGEVVHWKYWRRDGAAMDLDLSTEPVGVAAYSRYLDSYVLYEDPREVRFGDRVVRRSWLLHRSGRIRDFTPPSGPWMRGSTRVAPTRKGLFLVSHAAAESGNGAAGGYLQKGDTLRRLIAGVPVSMDVAPDGCEIALSIYDKHASGPVLPRIKAIDVCGRSP